MKTLAQRASQVLGTPAVQVLPAPQQLEFIAAEDETSWVSHCWP